MGSAKRSCPKGCACSKQRDGNSISHLGGMNFPGAVKYRAKHGCMMPEDGLTTIRHHDAIFFGACGFPGVPDHISLWELLIPMRRQFDLYVNLRPVRLMPGIRSPLAG